MLEDQSFVRIIRPPITAPSGQGSETGNQDQTLIMISTLISQLALVTQKLPPDLHNDRVSSKAKPCLLNAICYGAPSISDVNSLAASDPVPIVGVTSQSSSPIPILGSSVSRRLRI